jgi:hypothetical protein
VELEGPLELEVVVLVVLLVVLTVFLEQPILVAVAVDRALILGQVEVAVPESLFSDTRQV